MKFTGEYRIEAPRDAVWAAINDPEVLRRCIPGCEDIVCDTPTDWSVRVVAKVGPVKARFSGKIRLEDLDPPATCRIVGEGNGGAAGFASGGAVVRLVEEGEGTRLAYDAEAQIGGKLAQIGSRLIDSFARRYADDFFAAFARIVGGGEVAPAGGLPPVAPTEAAGATAVLAVTAPPEATLAPPSTIAPPPVVAPAPSAPTPPAPARFDAQSFTIVVLALLLVFMTIMVVIK